MSRGQKLFFWVVAAFTAQVCCSGLGYMVAAILIPLKVNIFGHPFPAWILGMAVAAWGGYTGYRLYKIFTRTARLTAIQDY